MKKIFSFIVVLIAIFTLSACNKDDASSNATNQSSNDGNNSSLESQSLDVSLPDHVDVDGDSLVIHYHRNDATYSGWNLWFWADGLDGKALEFNGADSYGVFAKYSLTDLGSAEKYGFIVRTDDWAKDPDGDRFITIANYTKNSDGEINIYLMTSDSGIYTSAESAFGPKVTTCQFTSFENIKLEANKEPQDFVLYQNDKEILSADCAAEKVTDTTYGFDVKLDNSAILTDNYKIKVNFTNGMSVTKSVVATTLFDTDEFNNLYGYDGDLGAIYTPDSTTFKLWAPLSQKVTLKLYNNGTPTSINKETGSDLVYKQVDLTLGNKGVWSTKIDENLDGKYYTYTVTNGNDTNEVCDPYARSAGINGIRGEILDFSKLNPEGWDNINFEKLSPNDLVIYELHTRDLTMDSTWNGSEANRGKFLGLSESGTTYTDGTTTVSTGFDHIKELGVNAVQILPIFDQDNNEVNPEFNWGYNPKNYNVLEGSYSSNPYDGATRVKEFKQVVKDYSDAGIRVIMDVVYNHTSSTSSNLNLIVPNYYYRQNAEGSFSNGSGCGNETASDRYMYRKFMIDSTSFLAKEYNLKGFRFDLMGLHDTYTMDQIAENLHNTVDPNIVVYGEPWTGGTTPLASDVQASSNNIGKMETVGAFNDKIRDAIKGSVFETTGAGWVQSKTISSDDYKYIRSGIAGGVTVPGSITALYGSPSQTLNYVSCHDNNTLYDKLMLSTPDGTDVTQMDIQANTIVMLSEGIPFIQAGAEILRSKADSRADNSEVVGGYNKNSYNAPDSVNSIKWNEKIDNINVFEAYKKVIKFRKEHRAFRLSTSSEVKSAMEFVKQFGETSLDSSTLCYNLNYGGDNFMNMTVIHNGNNAGITIDASQYKVVFDSQSLYDNNTTIDLSKLTLKANQSIVLSKN